MNTEKIADRIYKTFDDAGNTQSLSVLCNELLAQQTVSWLELGNAYRALRGVRLRNVHCRGFSVRLIFNPGRAVNTTASVGPQDIRERPCFLCPSNLPEQQKGILYRNKYLILGNPRPAVPSHLTLASLEHRPQGIFEHADDFLQIAAELGAGWTTLYNGPRCGASAPDHLHFQAVPSGLMPIENEINDKKNLLPVNRDHGIRQYLGIGLGRDVIVIEGEVAHTVQDVLCEHLEALKKKAFPSEEEPMVNIMGHFNGESWRLLVFPRRAHRPAAFFKEGEERIVVSPAVMEMAGVIVTPMERDFDRLDAATIESIYREVSLVHS